VFAISAHYRGEQHSQRELLAYNFDGNENAIAAHLSTDIKRILGKYDVDEINVCRTLQSAGVPVPPVGTVIVFSDLAGASQRIVYGWSTSYIGKFSENADSLIIPWAGQHELNQEVIATTGQDCIVETRRRNSHPCTPHIVFLCPERSIESNSFTRATFNDYTDDADCRYQACH
jgi:hypothetical protein